MTPDNNTGDMLLDSKNSEVTEENTDNSSDILVNSENPSENEDKASDSISGNTDLDKDNIDTYNEIDNKSEEQADTSTQELEVTADTTSEQTENSEDNLPKQETSKEDSKEQSEEVEDREEQAEETEDIQEQNDTSEPEQTAENANSDEQTDTSNEQNSEAEPEQNSPFGASAPSEASQRGLDFEGENLKMGVLENSVAEPAEDSEDGDNDEEQAQSTDNADEPELTLEDLDEYREEAKIEAPEKLVDINEFLAMKRKSEAAKEEKKKKKKKKADIFINRRKAKTLNAAVAAADPIIYFYNAALDKTGKVVFFNVYQVLQDRFMGKLIPQQYTAVAEGSSKIEELNIANIIEQVKVANQYPQYGFVVSISARFFTRPKILEKLTKELVTENKNLILAFDCVSLQNIGTAAKTGLSILRLNGAKIMLDNTEAVSMTSLTELEYDYIRIDARYYEKGDERALSYLELLARFAESQGITTSATFCDEAYLAEYMLSRGITAVQGDAVSRPMRTVPNTVKAVTLLPSMLDD